MMRTRLICCLLVVGSALTVSARSETMNIARLAKVEATAQMDGQRGAYNVNDGDERTYWSAWGYNIREGDTITLSVTFPEPFDVTRIAFATGVNPRELLLRFQSDDGVWAEEKRTVEDSGRQQQFEKTWFTPERLTGLEVVFLHGRATGAVIAELEIDAELPDRVRILQTLNEADTPVLDWDLISPASYRSKEQLGEPIPRVSVQFAGPQELQRVEVDWDGANYARRTLLRLTTEDGNTLYYPRLVFCSSFTLPEPVRITRADILCIRTGEAVGTSGLRFYSHGTEPVPPKHIALSAWPETALAKVPRDASGPVDVSPFARTSPLRISLCRNEYEGGQIVLRNNGDETLRNVRVSVPDFRTPGGEVLQGREVLWNPVGYVNNEYADVLMESEPFSLKPGEVRPVWVTVHASADQPAGYYREKVSIHVGNRLVQRFPVEIEVWDVVLPKETHVRSHYFGIWGTPPYIKMDEMDREAADTLIRETRDLFIRHRLAPSNVFLMQEYLDKVAKGEDWGEFLETFDSMTRPLEEAGLPFFGRLNPLESQQVAGKPGDATSFWKAVEEHLKERGWIDRFAYAVGDEPPPGNQRVTNACRRMMAMAPDIRRQCAFSSYGKGGTDTWVGLVNEYGINPRCWGEGCFNDLVDFSQERLAAGDGVSWYIHFALSVEESPYFPRIYFWLLDKYGIEGCLLYGVSEWAHREVGRWEDDFVIHGNGFRTWGVTLWPGRDRFLSSVRWEAIRDGIEDTELRRLLRESSEELEAKSPGNKTAAEARSLLDRTEDLFVALKKSQAGEASQYRIADLHAEEPTICTNAIPADLLNRREELVHALLNVREALNVAAVPESDEPVPQWAALYTEGLKAWRDLIYYWLDRQHKDGTFGFGWGEDCEMAVGWPAVMMAADDKRIEEALARLAENRWYNPNIQRGYIGKATDPEHGPEPISYTSPVLYWQRFGSPEIIERLMVTAQNLDYWLARTLSGDLHMQSSYFGSGQMYLWEYYHEDSPINARAWIPMMYLAQYNRDPYLMERFFGWADSWAKHAMGTEWGKPPGFLPGSIEFDTDEAGGYTHNWWGAGAHDFTSLWYRTRLYEVLAIAYDLSGDPKYLEPMEAMLDFLSTYARPRVDEGEELPPDRLPAEFTFPAGWRDGTASTKWALDAGWGHFNNWYYYLTGKDTYDEKFSEMFPGRRLDRGPYKSLDHELVERAHGRATSMRDRYFTETVPRLEDLGSVANYAAAWWAKRWGSMAFGQRCFHDGGNLANSVNWPWVDYPPPAVIWKDTGYETAVFVLQDDRDQLRVNVCNTASATRNIGMQFFTLDTALYHVRLGLDADKNGESEAILRKMVAGLGRGSTLRFDLPPRKTCLIELSRLPGQRKIGWEPLPDPAIDPGDIILSKASPRAGDAVTVTVRLHNIGSAAVEDFSVRIVGRGPEGVIMPIGNVRVASMAPPEALVPSHLLLEMPWRVAEGIDEIGARIVPDSGWAEIYSGNNEAWVRLNEAKTEYRRKEVREIPPARKKSLADVAGEEVSEYHVPYREGIDVDGVIGEEEWRGVPVFDFRPAGPDVALQRGTKMRMAWDESALYLAFDCEEPHPERLDTELKDVHDIYYKDGFEIFIDPNAEVWRYWQFVFDTAEHQFMTKTRNEFAPRVKWQVKVKVGKDRYTAEVRFPFSEFGVGTPVDGAHWRLNAMRYTTTLRDPEKPGKRVTERSHFSPKGALHSHHAVEKFGDIWFE